MSVVEVVGLVLSTALFLYLLAALVKPEWFA